MFTPAPLSILLLLLPALAHAHGLITWPPPRTPGAATSAACGAAIAGALAADPTSHVEGLAELGAREGGYDAAACNVWLCRGLQFGDDDAANVQAWAPGESVAVRVRLAIPHAGAANVSVVDAAANRVLGAPLAAWPAGYADEAAFYAGATPPDQTDFNVTIPEDLGDRCATPGACVLQWWWYGTGAKQTYESCVDFTVTEA
ncbi:hypothetical protein F4809DRAFT_660622 [Biscogniauxia mediterranea]|nr:hypothetical protein F4809DRAFT_660622 [Biscogniauxia mediterranea]